MAGIDVNTKLMLNLNGSDGATSTTDESDSAHSVSFVGTAQLDTAIKKFGSASLLVDGDSDYLSIADSADWDVFGTTTESWTIEAFMAHATGNPAGDEIIISQTSGSAGWDLSFTSDERIRFRFYGAGSFTFQSTTGLISDTSFHHIAVVKIATVYGIYLDGVQIAYAVDSGTATFAHALEIGGAGYGDKFNGNLDSIRVQKSNIFSAVPVVGLTDTITVPTEEYNNANPNDTYILMSGSSPTDQLDTYVGGQLIMRITNE